MQRNNGLLALIGLQEPQRRLGILVAVLGNHSSALGPAKQVKVPLLAKFPAPLIYPAHPFFERHVGNLRHQQLGIEATVNQVLNNSGIDSGEMYRASWLMRGSALCCNGRSGPGPDTRGDSLQDG